MSRPICPISKRIVDLTTQPNGKVNFNSAHGRWYTRIFIDAFEAIDWMNNFDLLAAIPKATEKQGPNGTVKLVGDGWQTKFMQPEELEAFKAHGKAPAKSKAPTKKPVENKPTDAEVKQ